MVKSSEVYSNQSVEWSTPQAFFDHYDNIFLFTLDACASDLNHKVDKYYTVEDDGLKQNWAGERVWCNPPYDKSIAKWVKKCYEESLNGALVVALIPSRTDTAWWHEYVQGKAMLKFIKGRLHFNGSKTSATFPNVICIWGI